MVFRVFIRFVKFNQVVADDKLFHEFIIKTILKYFCKIYKILHTHIKDGDDDNNNKWECNGVQNDFSSSEF